ncbi:MAG TPA: YpdA family putative bacillithiol disulfide reductase [Bryobacterales bacterium]|jgi:thioredoxin reductase (NADPH)|nr:YpdA family putative bacillithiol disulfide reductase [Bryobacterales bacterium]
MPHDESLGPIYDALVIGAGPTGLACAIEIQIRGMQVALIEKGCLVNSLYHYPPQMTFFTTPELLEIGNIPMTSIREKPTRTEALKYYRRVAQHYKLDVRQYERVERIEGEDGDFRVFTSQRYGRKACHRSRKIILATGYYDLPNLLNIPGEDLPKVMHYYGEPHPYYDSDVAVIGGKNSAAIAALELYWTGARVTLIHRRDRLSDHIKYWIKPNIENRLKNGEITGYLNSWVEEITEDCIRVRTPDGIKWLKNDFVFALTGYHPDIEFLRATGIEFDPESQRPRTNPETLESDRAGVYLAGVLVAGMHTNEIFIENGRFHGCQIARDIAARLRRT